MSAQLDTLQRAAGAVCAAVGGQQLPARFSGLEREWVAVRQRCGVLDARFRGLLRLGGSDRLTFLQGMLTNDVVALKDGQGAYAALLTVQGHIVSDLRVYVLADEIWLDLPVQRVGAVRESLDRYIIADDVEFVADGDAMVPLVAIEGPHAAAALAAACGGTVTALPALAHRAVDLDGRQLRIAAASHCGERGYLICGAPEADAELWQRLCAAGAEPVGMDALDVLRLEAGIPWYDRDMDESMLISEVGLEAAISFRKGCYLGQEVVERVVARGQVHRKLVGLVCDALEPPDAKTKLQRGGKDVGWITSARWSPAVQAVVALGYVRRECWEVGTDLLVALPGASRRARVTRLPFYAARETESV